MKKSLSPLPGFAPPAALSPLPLPLAGEGWGGGVCHWSETYLGREWLPGSHDCWQFFRIVQREQFALEVPESGAFDAASTLSCARALSDDAARAQWQEVARPTEGDAVLLARNTTPSHVGVWVNANSGGVLHCVRGAGVVLQDKQSLARHGWGSIRFYRHMECRALECCDASQPLECRSLECCATSQPKQ